MFKTNSDQWQKALSFAQQKEKELIKRCKTYLYTSKAVVENAQAQYHQLSH